LRALGEPCALPGQSPGFDINRNSIEIVLEAWVKRASEAEFASP
jgi:hypothetical protein